MPSRHISPSPLFLLWGFCKFRRWQCSQGMGRASVMGGASSVGGRGWQGRLLLPGHCWLTSGRCPTCPCLSPQPPPCHYIPGPCSLWGVWLCQIKRREYFLYSKKRKFIPFILWEQYVCHLAVWFIRWSNWGSLKGRHQSELRGRGSSLSLPATFQSPWGGGTWGESPVIDRLWIHGQKGVRQAGLELWNKDKRENVKDSCWTVLENNNLIFSGFYVLNCSIGLKDWWYTEYTPARWRA